jgi:hypothetical protein
MARRSVGPSAGMFEAVIGKPLNDPTVQLLLRSIQGQQEASDLEGELSIEVADRGLAFTFDARPRLSAIFFEGRKDPPEGVPFVGRLPRGLTFEMSRDAVRARLGKPTASRDPEPAGSGEGLAWDRFDEPDVSLHVQYGAGGARVDLVTLMAPWRVPA